MASLVHMPPWIQSELYKLVFNFFWKEKRDLVARCVVVQSPSLGGFSVVDVKFKVWSLLVQWIRRFASSPSFWTAFLHFWFRTAFNEPVISVLSYPFRFSPAVLPPFYRSLILAWRAMDGSFSSSRSSLVMASMDPYLIASVSDMTAQSCYQYLLSENYSQPHCVEKFLPSFGSLYWSTTWRELFFFDSDRPVVDLNWKIAHGVLYTTDHLLSFGYAYDPFCFCGHVLETPSHLFFDCPLASYVLSWLQALMLSFSTRAPIILCRHVLFGFSSVELRRVPRIFVYMICVCKYFVWLARNDFRLCELRPGAIVIIEKGKACVRFHLPIFFKRFRSPRRRRYFHRQWGAEGIVGSATEGCLLLRL